MRPSAIVSVTDSASVQRRRILRQPVDPWMSGLSNLNGPATRPLTRSTVLRAS